MRYRNVVFWLACAGIAGWFFSTTNECTQYTEGTDMYWECVTGEEIDLGIQDEVDTLTSQQRGE